MCDSYLFGRCSNSFDAVQSYDAYITFDPYLDFLNNYHCVKSAYIRSYSGPHFSTFGLNTVRYSVSLVIQSECGKIGIRITPYTDAFHAV